MIQDIEVWGNYRGISCSFRRLEKMCASVRTWYEGVFTIITLLKGPWDQHSNPSKPFQTIPNPSEPIQTSGCSGCSKHFKTKKQKSSALSLRSSRNDEDLNHFRHTWESHGVPESQSEFRPASPHKQKRLEKHVLDNNDNIWIFGCYMMLFLIFF